MNTRRITRLVGLAPAAALASTLCATDFDWSNAAGGTYGTGANWSPTGIPGSGDRASYGLPGTYSVSFLLNRSSQHAEVTGGLLTLTSQSTPRIYFVSDTFDVFGGVLTISDLEVRALNFMSIGNAGNVLVGDGGVIEFKTLTVGANMVPLSGLNVIGPTASVRSGTATPSSLTVGANGGAGSLNVCAGATVVVNDNVFLAYSLDPGCTAEVFIDGGSTLTAGSLQASLLGGAGASSTCTVNGAGSRVELTTGLVLGNTTDGSALLTVQNGAELDLGAVLNRVRPSGTLALAGGTVLIDENLLVEGGTFTADSSSTITLADGATLAVCDGGTIDWNVSALANSGTPSQPVVLDVASGGLFEVSFGCTLGSGPGRAGTASVDGGLTPPAAAGVFMPSTLRGAGGGAGGDLRVGVDGHGELCITNGAFVSFRDDGVLAAGMTATANVIVSGIDAGSGTRSTLDLTIGGAATQLIMAQAGTASMEVRDGALVSVAEDAFLASAPSGCSDVLVSGTAGGHAATIMAGDDLFVAGAGAAGGTAALRIDFGGRVIAGDRIVVWGGGTVELENGGRLTGATLENLGTIEGNGDIDVALLTNAALIDPGDQGAVPQAGELDIFGDLVQTPAGTLRLDFLGETSGEHDRLDVGGNLDLDGTLIIGEPSAYEITPGVSYEIMTFDGAALDVEFDTISAPRGLVPVFDVTAFAVLLSFVEPCSGDLDGDGNIGFTDLNAVLSNWGACPGCPEDLDGDGNVGFTDLNAVLSNWGACG